MIDVKKLVTGFLVLAVAASAAALLISGIGGGVASSNNNTGILANTSGVAIIAGTGNTANASGTGGNEQQPGTAFSGNAFLPQIAADNSADGPTTGQISDPTVSNPALASTTDAIMSDPNNLTNILASVYLNNLALTNPSGPQVDGTGTGNMTLTPPDPSAVIAQFESSSTAANLQVPDWDTEAAEVPIVITSSSPSAIATYGAAINEILNENIIQTNLQSMLNGNSDPSFEPYVAGKIQTSLQDISGLQTPASVMALQKSLIKTLVYAKNTITLAENVSADPLKTELILEAEDTKYQAAIQDLQNQIQNAKSQNLFSLGDIEATPSNEVEGSGVLADIQSIIGIPVAHAQFGGIVHDPINNIGIWATVGQLIQAQLKDIALQIIKNTIVFAMQKTIFSAIKGSGAPAFIQQWGNTLANAFQNSALNALNSQMACVGAAPFAPQLRLTLGATYLPGNNNVCAVQFSNQLAGNTLKNFYNNFANGGWVTYGSTLQPDNDYYGSVFFTAQAVGDTAQNAQSAAQAKAIANQGFHGSAVCDDGSNPSGQSTICEDATGREFASNGSTCPQGDIVAETIPNNGFCTDGTEPEVQTPGATFNGMVNSAVNGNFSLITSANSWEGLASGLFVSVMQQVLNSLAQTTISDANGLLQQAAQGGGASGVSGNGLNVTSGASSPQPITCFVAPNPSGNPLVADISVTGGEVITSSGISTPSYTWTQPADGTLSATTGDTVTATFTASGTYPVTINDFVDSANTTCQVQIPVPPAL